jgi:hypothetical protein
MLHLEEYAAAKIRISLIPAILSDNDAMFQLSILQAVNFHFPIYPLQSAKTVKMTEKPGIS